MTEPTHYATTIVPTAVHQDAPLVPAEGRRVVGYERYAGMLVPVYEAPAPAARVETVVVRRGVDEVAQRLVAAGVCAAGTGWGIGQAVAPFTAGGGGFLVWLVLAALVLRRPANRTTTITTHNNGWLSHSHTTKG